LSLFEKQNNFDIVAGKPFQSGLIFVSKAWSLKGATFCEGY